MQLTLFPSDSLSSYRFFINTGKNFKRRLHTQQKFSYHLLSIQYRSEHRLSKPKYYPNLTFYYIEYQ